MRERCPWAGADPLMIGYHDTEWGVPSRDDRHLFEMLLLEGAQAGLSWSTILRRRERYRAAFHRFDARRITRYGDSDVARLLADEGIIRNRLKVQAAIGNARAFLEVQREEGSFHEYIWSFVGGRPRVNRWRTAGQVPASTPESDAMSRDLKRRGFAFVGTTICYAFMQATGMVNDHLTTCFRHAETRRTRSGSSGHAETRRTRSGSSGHAETRRTRSGSSERAEPRRARKRPEEA